MGTAGVKPAGGEIERLSKGGFERVGVAFALSVSIFVLCVGFSLSEAIGVLKV